MTEEELNKLKFREHSHTTFDDRYLTIYECMSEPLADRLFVNLIRNRDKNTGDVVGKGRIYYSLDGKVYKTKEKFLEAIKDEK